MLTQKSSDLARRGGLTQLRRPKYAELGIRTVSSPHLTHSNVRCSKPGPSGMIRVTIMPLPQLGQRRRGIGYLIWLVGCDAYTEIPYFRIAPRNKYCAAIAMKLFNSAHFHRSRLLRLFERTGGHPKARGMLDELSQLLFNQNSIAGWEYQNWMLVIGLPIVIFFIYLSERGFHWRSADPPAEPSEKSE